jgi:phosphoenolpyruvate carboxylase
LFISSIHYVALRPPASPSEKWRDVMELMSETSCENYRNIVFKHPKFVEYFRMSTPEPELAFLNLGSRVCLFLCFLFMF